jgi:hypothetical protein
MDTLIFPFTLSLCLVMLMIEGCLSRWKTRSTVWSSIVTVAHGNQRKSFRSCHSLSLQGAGQCRVQCNGVRRCSIRV